MGANTNQYQKIYMKEYVKKSPKITCPLCGFSYKLVYKYNHNKSNAHISLSQFINNFETIL